MGGAAAGVGQTGIWMVVSTATGQFLLAALTGRPGRAGLSNTHGF
jgi:hypothetical protein